MRRAALIVLGRDHPDFVRDFGGDGFEYGEAGGVEAVVVGQQHTFNDGFEGGHRESLLVGERIDRLLQSLRCGASAECRWLRLIT